MANNYQRLFYIFKNMDGDMGHPTGYIRVEINYEVAKLQISLGNLQNRQGLIYKLYGIQKDDKQLKYTVICDIPNENGRADIKINTDIHNIGSNRLQLEDINIFAVIIKLPNRVTSIQCPLVAYTYRELEWRKEFEALLTNKELSERKINTENETGDCDFKRDRNTEQELDILAEIGRLQELRNEEINASDEVNNVEIGFIEEVRNVEMEGYENINNMEVSDGLKNVVIETSSGHRDDEAYVFDDIENSKVEALEELEEDELPDIIEGISNKFNITDKFESAITSIYNANNSTFENSAEVISNDIDILSSVEKNFKDISAIDIDTDRIKGELDLPSLKEELDKSFEGYNPFNVKSKSFRWWKINSPGYLNNILFRNNIKTYLLFNPNVMLAHYKYRYIIFGIRVDKRSGKEYFICGVPGVYSIDENPFGDMGSWSQLEGYRPKYGAFGYWVIRINPRTGKLIKIK